MTSWTSSLFLWGPHTHTHTHAHTYVGVEVLMVYGTHTHDRLDVFSLSVGSQPPTCTGCLESHKSSRTRTRVTVFQMLIVTEPFSFFLSLSFCGAKTRLCHVVKCRGSVCLKVTVPQVQYLLVESVFLFFLDIRFTHLSVHLLSKNTQKRARPPPHYCTDACVTWRIAINDTTQSL